MNSMQTDVNGKQQWMVPFGARPSNLMWFLVLVVVLSGVVLGWQLSSGSISTPIIASAGLMFTISLVLVMRSMANPDSVRARQTGDMLKLSRQTLACLKGGLDEKSAQKLCSLLFPNTDAVSVCITDKESVLGYEGLGHSSYKPGDPIFATTIAATAEDGEPRTLLSHDEIGFKEPLYGVEAAIIMPLRVGKRIEGTLTFFFHSPRKISSTQKTIAESFAQLVSTQLAAEALEGQQKLATSMELKALQSQINPHFLFNTINTIASLVRTDPNKARVLLREFAVFYRRTLDDSSDLIPLSREVEQTMRYFSFEMARFGEDRVGIELDIEPEVEDLMVPPFLIQPLVENSVQHAMPAEGKLTVTIGARPDGDDNVIIWVADNGVGMTEEACQNILHPESARGIGIAVKNVHDRMCGYFGPGTHMEVASELGSGTTVRLVLNRAALEEFLPE